MKAKLFLKRNILKMCDNVEHRSRYKAFTKSIASMFSGLLIFCGR